MLKSLQARAVFGFTIFFAIVALPLYQLLKPKVFTEPNQSPKFYAGTWKNGTATYVLEANGDGHLLLKNKSYGVGWGRWNQVANIEVQISRQQKTKINVPITQTGVFSEDGKRLRIENSAGMNGVYDRQ